MTGAGRRRAKNWFALGVVAVTVLGACQPVGLRTFAAPASGPPILCSPASVLPFRLVIDPSQSNPVWGLWVTDGSRFDVIWPPGFQLRMTPQPELVDPLGSIIGRNGELIDNAGGSGGDPVTICSLGSVTYPLDLQ